MRWLRALGIVALIGLAALMAPVYYPIFFPDKPPAKLPSTITAKQYSIDAIRVGMRVVSKSYYPLGKVYRIRRDSTGKVAMIEVNSRGLFIVGVRVVSRFEINSVRWVVKLKILRGDFRTRPRVD